jgi:hypothetical protein
MSAERAPAASREVAGRRADDPSAAPLWPPCLADPGRRLMQDQHALRAIKSHIERQGVS